MIKKYRELEILCVDHCEVNDDICSFIFRNFENTKLQFLNISWNQISGDCLDLIKEVLLLNQDMEKLAMQHNKFG